MTENKGKFLIDVTPLTRIPLSREQFFYYLFDKKISPGTLVNISLGMRKIQGIVLKSKDDFPRLGNYRLKKIENIVEENFLSPNQIKLAKFISDYYFSPLGIVFKSFVPARAKERIRINQTTNNKQQLKKEIKLTLDQEIALKKISTINANGGIADTKHLLFGKSSSGKTEVIIQTAKKITLEKNNAQALILVPELTHIPSLFERISPYFPENEIAVLHSKISKGNFFSTWQKIKSGKAKIILGTRQAIFAPFTNLKMIAIDEEQDISYKQWDMNPRYDTRKVAEKLAEIHGATIVFSSATPRIETFWRTKNGELTFLEISDFETPPVDCEIIDMRKEKWTDFAGKKKPNYSFLSIKLQQEISYALKNNLQIILFVNHQGMSKFSVCTKCKTTLKCPKCNRSLILEKNSEYRCLHCSYSSGAFPTCKKCSNLEFRNIGIGTGSVEREVRKKFPSANISLIDTPSSRKSGFQEELLEKFSKKEIDILVGTQMITKNWDISNVGLVGIIDADSLFDIPDFTTDEQGFQNIMQAIGRTGRVGAKFKSKAIIQTYSPDLPIIKFAAEKNFESFYEKQIQQRQDLSYPPFAKIIKLTCQSQFPKKLEKETKNAYDSISGIIKNLNENIKIIGPVDPLVSNIRGKQKKQIILKSKEFENIIPKELKKAIQKLPPEWIIDIDPIQLA